MQPSQEQGSIDQRRPPTRPYPAVLSRSIRSSLTKKSDQANIIGAADMMDECATVLVPHVSYAVAMRFEKVEHGCCIAGL